MFKTINESAAVINDENKTINSNRNSSEVVWPEMIKHQATLYDMPIVVSISQSFDSDVHSLSSSRNNIYETIPANTFSPIISTNFTTAFDSNSSSAFEKMKSARRTEFLNLSRMTNNDRRHQTQTYQPFVLDPKLNQYSAKTAEFSLSPLYDIPYAPFFEPKSSLNVESTSSSSCSVKSHFITTTNPFSETLRNLSTPTTPTKISCIPTNNYLTTFQNKLPNSNVLKSPVLSAGSTSIEEKLHSCTVFSDLNKSSFSSYTESEKYPFSKKYSTKPNAEIVNNKNSKMNSNHEKVDSTSQMFPKSAASYISSATNIKIFASDEKLQPRFSPVSKLSKVTFPFDSGTINPSINATTSPTNFQTLKPPEKSILIKTTASSSVGQTKSVNFKLSIDNEIKINKGNFQNKNPEQSQFYSSKTVTDEYNTIDTNRRGLLKQSKAFENKSFTDKSSKTVLNDVENAKTLSAAEMFDLLTKQTKEKFVAECKQKLQPENNKFEQKDVEGNSTLTLLTIRHSFSSEDAKEKGSSNTVFGRIDRSFSPINISQTKYLPKTYSPTVDTSAKLSNTFTMSDSRILSHFKVVVPSLNDHIKSKIIPVAHSFGKSTATDSQAEGHIHDNTIYRNHPYQFKIDPILDQITTTTRTNQENRFSSTTQDIAQKMNKVSHFEGVIIPRNRNSNDANKATSFIKLERYSWKDDDITPGPSTTFIQHESTNVKEDDKTIRQSNIKMKTATIEGQDNLTLSQRIASASVRPACSSIEKHIKEGQKVVVTRLDVARGENVLTSDMVMDTYKLYKEPSSTSQTTAMKWNAVRRMTQHMFTDAQGNRHFFFIGSLFPRRSCFKSTDYTWKAFKVFDKNLDGYVSLFELCKTFKDLGMKKTTFELCNIMDETDSNRDGMIDYFEFARMFKRSTYEFCAKRAAELYEVHSSARHDHEDLLVRNKYKYLSNKCSNASESSWVEQLRTVFKMTDTDSSGKARLFDLNKNLKSITGDKSKYLGYDLFQGSLARDARKVSFEEFYKMMFEHQREKMNKQPIKFNRC